MGNKVKDFPNVPNICNQELRELCQNKDVSIAHIVMEPGNVSLPHKHKNFTEVYYILEGNGIMWLDKEQLEIHPEMIIKVPPNTVHKVKNTGKTQLKHLVISNPSFDPKDVDLIKE